MMLTSRTSFQTKNYKVILNLTADLPYKLFCQKQFNNKNQRLTRKIPNQVWNDFLSKQQTAAVFCPPCGESTARSGVRGLLSKETSFYNPPTALQATSPTRGAGKSGFTLIELLVVVLIIGILAAVAVPQYQVAVAKSRLAAIKPLLSSFKSAQESFYLANGYYSGAFSQLDIDHSCTSGNLPDESILYCDKFFNIDLLTNKGGSINDGPQRMRADYCPGYSNNLVECRANSDFIYILFFHNTTQPDKIECYGVTNFGKQVCAGM